MPHRVRRAAALALLSLAAGAPAAAQQSVIRGRVVTSDSAHRPVEGAEVAIPALQRIARSAADGEYVLDRLPGGAHVLVVRRLGFVPVTRGVIMSGEADDTAAVTFGLAPRVAEMPTVSVRDAATPAPRATERERARTNGGAFIDRATLARNEHSTMANVLRGVPGISIVRVPSTRGPYNALGSARGVTRLRGSSRARSPYCFYQIYVDGVLRYAPSDDPSAEPPPDVDELRPNEFEAVEVYRGGAQVPSQYGGTGAACGTVLLWSRTQ